MTARTDRPADFYRDAREAARELQEFIGEQMDQRPYSTLAAAAAVGYAFGLPRGAVALLAGLYSRMALGWFETLFEEAPATRARRRRRTR
jgi:hypothetical protein